MVSSSYVLTGPVTSAGSIGGSGSSILASPSVSWDGVQLVVDVGHSFGVGFWFGKSAALSLSILLSSATAVQGVSSVASSFLTSSNTTSLVTNTCFVTSS